MSYIRKTVDLFVVQQNYGNGWEDVTYEESAADAKRMVKDYVANTTYPTRYIKKRIKKEDVK